MSNKMLIDASHREETRVAVVRGNRVEEFDFESQEKRQLRGNIYLAKVTRVEPSLQAAFIDYGGNRHGFLAFSEIHPDYYQIPVADRQALLEAEAEEARALREAEEAEDDAQPDPDQDAEALDEDNEEEKPRSRRRRSRRSKKAEPAEETASEDETGSKDIAEDAGEAVDASPAEEQAEEEPAKPKRRSSRRKKAPVAAAEDEAAAETEGETVDAVEETAAEEPAKPKRRTTRRKKAAAPAEDDAATETDAASDEDGDTPKIMEAIVEMDSISEPLPGEDDDADREPEQDEVEAAAEPAEETEKPAKRRITKTRRSRKKPETEAVEEEAASAEAAEEEETTEASAEPAEENADEKPKRKSPRRRRSSKKAKDETAEESVAEDTGKEAEAKTATPEDDEDGETEDETIESVGKDDELDDIPSPRSFRRQYKIQEVIKRRQVMLIQVVKEERGNKGAALTTYLSLAGRYSVLMPNTARGGGISRKITNSSDRKRLKQIAGELDVPQGMGVILRTAGASRTKDEIDRDFQYLMRLWEQVRNLTLSSTAPCLVYEEGSLIKRSIRDLYSKDTGEVLVAGEEGYKEARDFMEMLLPDHVDKVKPYRGSQAIFAKYGVEAHLESMVSPQVTLKSGGYLVINQTEALVAVDVNSGRATREHSVEKTALQTNLEAAEEVARQLRLRDLAGLIVIDFIDMEERRNNRAVEKKLKECLKNDRARIQVGRISHFGLLEMSRQRIRASVLDSTMDVCPHCAGVGYIRSESANALHIFRALEEHVGRHRNRDVILHTTPQIAAHMLNQKRAALYELETSSGVQIVITSSAEMTGQEFRIEKGDKASGTPASSAVGMDNDFGSDEEEENGKSRNRRRKRKNTSENDDDAEVIAAGGTEASGSEDDDDRPRKKRRRRRRGGKNRGDGEANMEAADTENGVSDGTVANEDAEVVEAPKEAAAPVEASEEVEEATEDARPKSRSTRRRKAPIAPAEPSEAEEATAKETSAEAEPSSTPPRPARRTTRRKKEEVVDAVAEAGLSSDSNGSDAVGAEGSMGKPAAASSDDGAEAGEDGDGSKKKSWWSRGTGFF